MSFTPTKLYYKIREVSEIVGVEAHVLRFWETEFPTLSPPKSKSGQRTYRPKDIELLLRIRELLYDEGFTIPGARKQLEAKKPAETPKTAPPTSRSKRSRKRTESRARLHIRNGNSQRQTINSPTNEQYIMIRLRFRE